MKKDIFTTWIKEFCSLVFIQTIQAFIFAIVMAVIISIMTPSNVDSVQDKEALVASTGLIAVIALASISKIEDLVKKIFGVQSSVTDPSMRGGMKSLASTMIAAKLARGVLDNGKKMFGGIGGVYSANKKMRVAQTRYVRDINRKLGSDGGNANLNAANASVANLNSSNQAPTSRDYMAKAIEAKKAGDMNGYYTNRGIAAGINKANNIKSSSNSIAAATVGGGNLGLNTANSSNSIAAATVGGGNLGLNTANLSNKDKWEIDKIRDTYNDKMSELKSQRAESIMKFGSGLLESAGTIVGGTAGALSGAALGETDDILRNGLAGMGLGDAIGSIPGKVVKGGKNLTDTIISDRKSIESFNTQISNLSDEARKNINAKRTLRGKYNSAQKEFNIMQKQIIDAGNLD